jgi:hypothetical protein
LSRNATGVPERVRPDRRFSAAYEQRGDRCWRAQIGLLWVGSDDKIIIGHGAVVTRFADGLPVATEPG